jgi:hypothetical protein
MNLGKVLRVYVLEPIKIPVPTGRRAPEPEEAKRPPTLERR